MNAATRLYNHFVNFEAVDPEIIEDGDGHIVRGGNGIYRIVGDTVVATGDVFVGGRVVWDDEVSAYRVCLFEDAISDDAPRNMEELYARLDAQIAAQRV